MQGPCGVMETNRGSRTVTLAETMREGKTTVLYLFAVEKRKSYVCSLVRDEAKRRKVPVSSFLLRELDILRERQHDLST